jgi:hypothetical protein
MQSGRRLLLEVPLTWLTAFGLLFAVVLTGCGEGYDPPESLYVPPGSAEGEGEGEGEEIRQGFEFEGQWKLISFSKDSTAANLQDSGLDIVLDIAADGTVRWHVKEDGRHYSYCSADDMVLTQDRQLKERVSLSYHHIIVDPKTMRVTQNNGLRQIHYTAVRPGGDIIELQDGHPPQGIIMLPVLNMLNEQDLISLTLKRTTIDFSDSTPTQYYARFCDIKSDIVDPADDPSDDPPENSPENSPDDSPPIDEQPPVIAQFELLSATPSTNAAIAFNLSGVDNDAISAWLINESAAEPAIDDAAWTDIKPATYTLSSGYGTKTVYAWAKDAGGNISEPASIRVEYINGSPCEYIETTVFPTSFQISNNSIVFWGGLASLYLDDHDFLTMTMFDTNDSIAVTVDFELENTEVSDLSVLVSSVSRQHLLMHPNPFLRTVYVYNYAAREWNAVDSVPDIGNRKVRSEISLSGASVNIFDYLGQDSAGDKLRFKLKIELSPDTHILPIHKIDLAQLKVTHPADPDCNDGDTSPPLFSAADF